MLTAETVELQNLQTFYIRLLFCSKTRVDYLQTPIDTLRKHQVPQRYLSVLPDMQSEAFQVECRGRAYKVASELIDCFPKTIRYLLPNVQHANHMIKVDWFKTFLSSSHFFKAELAFPDLLAVGKGYENRSKFFLWLRETRQLNSENCDSELRNIAYGEFCGNIMVDVPWTTEPFFKQFSNGIFWKKSPGKGLPVRYATSDSRIMEFILKEERDILYQVGIPDMDVVLSNFPTV